ncbi:MAG: GNAT family N-acetyltransferase [Deltaproteobacteria bacterium]|nr:GNAT family N-acetyltransferase [Deltaproteobacteria bacterium]
MRIGRRHDLIVIRNSRRRQRGESVRVRLTNPHLPATVKRPMKLHLIAICGTGMGSLAGLLKAAGHDVRGSDENIYPPMSDQLRALQVPMFDGFRPENLDWGPERVVVGNVCRKDHVEVLEAQRRGLPLVSFPALLSELFLSSKHSVVVAGTHGKTTTSSLIAHVLADAGMDPSFLIGGVPFNFGKGWRYGEGSHFVVEGDEYDSAFFDKGSKFLHYRPKTAILTSVELDHVDIFDSMDAVRAAFRRFVALLPEDGYLACAASSPEALAVSQAARCRVETYAACRKQGNEVQALWKAEIDEGRSPFRTLFSVTRAGEFIGTFEVGLTGHHNVENALGVVATGVALGLSQAELSRALARFAGVKRRQELRGIATGVSVFDDYGHHPTAVRETLTALRQPGARGRLVAIYEPRSATSRRATFQNEFADALAAADEVVVAPLFQPEKIPPGERFDIERLASDLRGRGTAARALPSVEAIVPHVASRVQPGDSVVIFSSGGFQGIHEKLLFALGDPIIPAKPQDMPRVREILRLTGVCGDDLDEDRSGDVLVVADESGIVGCVAVEVYDESGVLRSLAVVPERRGRGLGWTLADSAVARARVAGVKRLYLLTETASDFFAEKLGFRPVDRNSVDSMVVASRHFGEAHCRSAVAMRLDLAP